MSARMRGIQFEVARVTIELDAPFLVGTGEGDGFYDAVFVTDANDLPTISGETLAGVLRHAVADVEGSALDKRCRAAFGFQERADGSASMIQVSWGHVHDSKDKPVPFVGADLSDPVLSFLYGGVFRDHVRIGQHGAVDGRGKFDELLVPAGARFTFELVVERDSPVSLDELLGALQRPEVTLGKGTRRGLGAFHLVRVLRRSFDLNQEADYASYCKLPVSFDAPIPAQLLSPLDLKSLKGSQSEGWVSGTIELSPRGTWVIGGSLPGGGRWPDFYDREGKVDAGRSPDRFPLAERVVTWFVSSGQEKGAVTKVGKEQWLVPASSVKGALRHRVAFHARRLRGQWQPLKGGVASPGAPEEELALFGEINDDQRGSGSVGRVLLGDVRVGSKDGVSPVLQQHVGLDRFTQGPIDGRLYSECVLKGGVLKIPIAVRTRGLSKQALGALKAALKDLCEGRLGVGAGRGHGRFQGKFDINLDV